MPSHRRRRVGPLVRRATYLALWVRYQELLTAYRALEADNGLLIGDAEEAATAAEIPGRYVTPAWAVTEELPVFVPEPLDPEKATALVNRGGMLGSPGGTWG